MAEENQVENLPVGEMGEKEKQLARQIRLLEETLEKVMRMMDVERPPREQLMVIDVVGRTAIRLGALLRLQKQVAALTFVEDERERKRKEEEESWASTLRRMAAEERMAEVSREEIHKTEQAKRAQIAREMGADPAECEALYGEKWDPAKIHWK